MKKTYLTLIVLSFLSCACSGGAGDDAPDFTQAETVCPQDSIAINEILKPTSWTRVGEDKAVIFSEGTDTVAYVYRLPRFEFLYKWGVTGEGPEDFQRNPHFFDPSMETDDTLRIYERGRMKNYIMTDTAAVSTGITAENIGNYLPISSVGPVRAGEGRYYVIPKISVSFDGDEKQNRILRIYDDINDCVADSVYLDVVNVIKTYSDGTVEGNLYNIPIVMAAGDTLTVVYPQLHRVEAFRISAEGKLSELYAVGDTRKYEEIKNLAWDNMSFIKETANVPAVMDGEMYVFYLAGGNEAMYDYDFENISSYAAVYDMDGHVKRVKKFDRFLSHFMCHDGKIYAFSLDEDFENVYIYTL